jgi:hypothetical protein
LHLRQHLLRYFDFPGRLSSATLGAPLRLSVWLLGEDVSRTRQRRLKSEPRVANRWTLARAPDPFRSIRVLPDRREKPKPMGCEVEWTIRGRGNPVAPPACQARARSAAADQFCGTRFKPRLAPSSAARASISSSGSDTRTAPASLRVEKTTADGGPPFRPCSPRTLCGRRRSSRRRRGRNPAARRYRRQ